MRHDHSETFRRVLSDRAHRRLLSDDPRRSGRCVRLLGLAPALLTAMLITVTLGQFLPADQRHPLPLLAGIALIGVSTAAGWILPGGAPKRSSGPLSLNGSEAMGFLAAVDSVVAAVRARTIGEHERRPAVAFDDLVTLLVLQGVWSPADSRHWWDTLALRGRLIDSPGTVDEHDLTTAVIHLNRLKSLVTLSPSSMQAGARRRAQLAEVPRGFSLEPVHRPDGGPAPDWRTVTNRLRAVR